VWQLWREGRASELIGPLLGVCGEVEAIMRCIKVAMLCVQDNATDRPTMVDVTAMLVVKDGAASLPEPRLLRQLSHSTTMNTNDVSITTMQGR